MSLHPRPACLSAEGQHIRILAEGSKHVAKIRLGASLKRQFPRPVSIGVQPQEGLLGLVVDPADRDGPAGEPFQGHAMVRARDAFVYDDVRMAAGLDRLCRWVPLEPKRSRPAR